MKKPGPASGATSGARRYLVHLSCVPEQGTGHLRYLLRIQPWTAPSTLRRLPARERLFEDEYELTQVLNPLLPHGSDVRNVLSHIENPEGFFYLLHLQPEQAQTLGWRN